jgi:hypothetical protein
MKQETLRKRLATVVLDKYLKETHETTAVESLRKLALKDNEDCCYSPNNCSHHRHYCGPYERAVRMSSWHLRLNGYTCNWLTDEL